MLTVSENEVLTRVGPGSPMHDVMTRFWHPVLRSSDIEADGAPRQIRLLGEDFVAFRGADGRAGFVDEGCPHRRASLALARTGDCVLTCLFHGWKIDAEGRVVDVPSEPAERSDFVKKIRTRRYHVHEGGGLVWVHIGQDVPPAPPAMRWLELPPAHVQVIRTDIACNYAQLVEGLVDSSHVGILHARLSQQRKELAVNDSNDGGERALFEMPPKFYEVEDQPYGFTAAAIRDIGGGRYFTRLSEFVMPAYTFIHTSNGNRQALFYQLPVDDEHTVQWLVLYDEERELVPDGTGLGFEVVFDPKTEDFHRHARADNLWGQDRAKMEAGHPTGLADNFLFEDFALAESQKPIADRTREVLAPNDIAIARFRRVMLEAARVQGAGGVPRGAGAEVDVRSVCARALTYPSTEDWRRAFVEA
jgi:phthalate 4,5-dioxygenase oxygenase subunit